MRLIMRWSPISSVFSIEPDGITRAWQTVPLINRKAAITHSHPKISLWIFLSLRWPCEIVFRFSDFTGHLDRRIDMEFCMLKRVGSIHWRELWGAAGRILTPD